MKRWRGIKQLIHDGVDATVNLVHEGNESTARAVSALVPETSSWRQPLRDVDNVRRAATMGVLGTIKAVNRSIEAITDLGLDVLVKRLSEPQEGYPDTPIPIRSDVVPSKHWAGDATLALLNAAIGDFLEDTESPLEIQMVMRHGDEYLNWRQFEIENAKPHVVVFVHGLGTTEWCWALESEEFHGEPDATFGSMLERDIDATPVYLRYNTGRAIVDNGRDLANGLEFFVRNYPIDIERLTIIGHSMGGLVTRSASMQAERYQMGWPKLVQNVFYLASPHDGAPLARIGEVLATDIFAAVDLPATQVLYRILDARSAGVKDLGEGRVVEEQWSVPTDEPQDLPIKHAAHHFISATITKNANNPISYYLGDLMVQSPSASGPFIAHTDFKIHTSTHGGILHHELQNHPDVYPHILAALQPDDGSSA